MIYNDLMPRIVRKNCPEIPYWNSSPYGGAPDLESNDYGDRHHWIFMSADMEERITPEEYDKIACKFVSEFGCVGPTRKSSLHQYYGSADVDRSSAVWRMHTNTWEKQTVEAALRKHYADPERLSLDDYLLYAGLFQGVILGYALESMRCAKDNYGALIWSFNDAWGEIGWSIVDYYLTRKIAYYFVKRALETRRLVMRRKDGLIHIACLNDTPETLEVDLEYGYVGFDGRKADTAERTLTVAPFGKSVPAACMHPGAHDPLKGVYYVRAKNHAGIIPATLRLADFRALRPPDPVLSVTDVREDGRTVSFAVSSDTYAHAVHFNFDERTRLSDEYFDLLPYESRRVTAARGGIPLVAADLRARSVGPSVRGPAAV